MPRRDSSKAKTPDVVVKRRGDPFVGQVWRQLDKGFRYAVAKICGRGRHEEPMLRLISLNNMGTGIHLNNLHSEAEMRDNGYVPAGCVSPEWVAQVNQAKGVAMPEHVKEGLRAKAKAKREEREALESAVNKEQEEE